MSRHLWLVIIVTGFSAVAWSMLVAEGHYVIANFFSVVVGFLHGTLPTERLSARIVELEDALRRQTDVVSEPRDAREEVN